MLLMSLIFLLFLISFIRFAISSYRFSFVERTTRFVSSSSSLNCTVTFEFNLLCTSEILCYFNNRMTLQEKLANENMLRTQSKASFYNTILTVKAVAGALCTCSSSDALSDSESEPVAKKRLMVANVLKQSSKVQ